MSDAKPRILVVDDDQDICRNLSDILSDLGYSVDTALDGPTALELLRERPYEVALLDLRMPGMDGLALYREIKKLRAGTVALLVTAYAGPDTADEALAAGAWRVLPKPVDLTKLLGLVGEALEQPMVLIVDDDRDVCATLWDILRDRGYRVGLAHDPQEAKAEFRDARPKVVLIDLKLPNGDGGQVFQAVRAANAHARTILVTGHREEFGPLVGQVLADGADAVCYKPFDVPNLLTIVRRLASSRNGERAAESH